VGIAAWLPRLAKLFPNFSGYNKGLKYLGAPEEMAAEIIKKHVETYNAGNEQDFIDHALTRVYNTTDSTSMFFKETGSKIFLS